MDWVRHSEEPSSALGEIKGAQAPHPSIQPSKRPAKPGEDMGSTSALANTGIGGSCEWLSLGEWMNETWSMRPMGCHAAAGRKESDAQPATRAALRAGLAE